MNIPAISGLKFTSQISQRTEHNKTSNFGLVMAKPLLKDTVSFKATPKIANKTKEVNRITAGAVRKRLEYSEQKVRKFMDELFGDLIASEKEPKNPILAISPRLKSIESIQEKTGSREWASIDEIVENMTDLMGAKITLRNSNKDTVDSILGRFIPAIKSRKLEMIEIENKRPLIVKDLIESEACKYDYASINMHEKMIAIQNDVWKKGGSKQRVNHKLYDDFTEANYCAIHYIFRIPGKKPVIFELQIMGNNVNLAKHVDDFVYKKLDGKKPKLESSQEFDKIFEPLTNKEFFAEEPNAAEIVENARKKFNQYRGDVFLFQREKPDRPYTKKKNQEMFLPIRYKLFPSDIEVKYGISSLDFDYNNLFKVIQRGQKAKSNNVKQ